MNVPTLPQFFAPKCGFDLHHTRTSANFHRNRRKFGEKLIHAQVFSRYDLNHKVGFVTNE